MGNGAMNRRNENLNHIGAVHDLPSTRGSRPHPMGMYHELQRLHVNATQKSTTKPHPPTKEGNLNTQHADRSKSASVAESAQSVCRRPSLSVLEKAAMHHWHAEAPHDQPWSPVHLGTGAAHEDQHKKA